MVKTGNGIQKAFITAVVQHKRDHPAHAHVIIMELLGCVRSLENSLSDDPSIVACQILDAVPQLNGLIKHLDNWATIVNQCLPDEVPTHGGRLCS